MIVVALSNGETASWHAIVSEAWICLQNWGCPITSFSSPYPLQRPPFLFLPFPLPLPTLFPPHPLFHYPPSPSLNWGSGVLPQEILSDLFCRIWVFANIRRHNAVSGERLCRNKLFRTRLLIVLFNNININIVLHSIHELDTKIRDDTRWREMNMDNIDDA